MTAGRFAGLGLIAPAGAVAGLLLAGWGTAYLAGDAVSRAALVVPGLDKVLHVAGFFVAFVGAAWLLRRLEAASTRAIVLLAVSLVLVAVADEARQAGSVTRQFDPNDLLAGLCGIVLGLVAVAGPRRPARAGLAGGLAFLVAGYVVVEAHRTQRYFAAAITMQRAGDFAGAREQYLRALDAGVRTATLYNELGWVEIESGVGDPVAAVEYGARALALRPGDPDILDTYGWALHHAGRSAEALPYLERAYADKPDMFCIHYHLGEVYLALGQTDRGVMHLSMQTRLTDTREAARAEATLARLGHAPAPATPHTARTP
jgi:tetratricopeptide (TPR) repeat protein